MALLLCDGCGRRPCSVGDYCSTCAKALDGAQPGEPLGRSPAEIWPAGTAVLDRDGGVAGAATGSIRRCALEGCMGIRVYVRWPGGELTMPCSKGLAWTGTAWKIA